MGYKSEIFRDSMMRILSDDNSLLYHEVEIESQMNGELESVTIDKSKGTIKIRLKKDTREKQFNDDGDYIKPLDKDKDFEVKVIDRR